MNLSFKRTNRLARVSRIMTENQIEYVVNKLINRSQILDDAEKN